MRSMQLHRARAQVAAAAAAAVAPTRPWRCTAAINLPRTNTPMHANSSLSSSSSSSNSSHLPGSRSRQRHTQQARQLMTVHAGIDLSALGLDVPDIDAADIASYQQELSAEFDGSGVAVTFNNTDRVVEALAHGVVLVDRSHWGRLRVAGADRLALLHNQSTADFQQLRRGQGCDTVLVTSTARCLDLATALVLDSSVMLIVSPSMKATLLQRLDKYIFPADDVTVTDVSGKCCMLTLMGPQADDVMKELAGDAFTLAGEPYCSHQLLKFAGRAPVIVAVGTGLAIPGYTLIVDDKGAADLYAALINKGCVPMGEADWERARITQGRPAAGAELTEDHNPFEAGLCHAVSLSKGCYIGQETLAKLSNTNGVKQQLWGLQLSCRAAPGAVITAEPAGDESSSSSGSSGSSGPEVLGKLTSYANLEANGHFGVGYLRCRKGGAQVLLKGITVMVDGHPAKVVDVPHATRQLPTAAAAAGSSLQDRAAAAKEAKAAEKAAQEAAKAERLKAMQARLAAWQTQQNPQQEQQ